MNLDGKLKRLLKKGLLKFDNLNIPNGAMITKAELTVYKTDGDRHVVSGYKLLKDWQEEEATWDNAALTDCRTLARITQTWRSPPL